jgi:hypothetical protein
MIEYVFIAIIVGLSAALGLTLLLEVLLVNDVIKWHHKPTFKAEAHEIEPEPDIEMPPALPAALPPATLEMDTLPQFDAVPFEEEEENPDLANLNLTEITIRRTALVNVTYKEKL